MRFTNLFSLCICLSAVSVFCQDDDRLYPPGYLPTIDPFIRPDHDDFYAAPDNISDYANGQVIRWREPPNPLTYIGSYSDAWQILFKTQDTNNESVAIVTTLIKPCNAKPDQLVSMQFPEDAVFIGCAPSFNLQKTLVSEEFAPILEEGFYLNIADYEGMNSAFGAVVLAAHATLDSIRAVLSMTDIIGLTSETRTVLWGYSNGSLTSGWAAQIVEKYAPELHIVAVILGGFVASAASVVKDVNGQIGVGYVIGLLTGIATQYPELESFIHYLRPNMSDTFLNIRTLCREEYLDVFKGQNFYDYFTIGEDIMTELPIAEIISTFELGNSPISAPMMVYTGTLDDATGIDQSDAGVSRYCNLNSSVTYYRLEGLNHEEGDPAGFPLALDFASSALAGLKATQVGCTTINTSVPTSISVPSAFPTNGCNSALIQAASTTHLSQSTSVQQGGSASSGIQQGGAQTIGLCYGLIVGLAGLVLLM